jgi:hypothetical protein
MTYCVIVITVGLSLLTPKDWISEIFKDQHVLPLYYDPSMTGANRHPVVNYALDDGCIVDDLTK